MVQVAYFTGNYVVRYYDISSNSKNDKKLHKAVVYACSVGEATEVFMSLQVRGTQWLIKDVVAPSQDHPGVVFVA